MAELVDALDLKSNILKSVRVRLPSGLQTFIPIKVDYKILNESQKTTKPLCLRIRLKSMRTGSIQSFIFLNLKFIEMTNKILQKILFNHSSRPIDRIASAALDLNYPMFECGGEIYCTKAFIELRKAKGDEAKILCKVASTSNLI